MPLREEIENQGNWLFRKRSFIPLLTAPLLASAFLYYRYPADSHSLDLIWEMICLAASFLGLSLRAYTTGCTPRRTSGRNTRKGQVADHLNTTGIYSLVRHPLYLANFLVALGPVMFFHQMWIVLVYALLFWFYYERIMFAEEEFLRDRFGDAYLEWAKSTPAVLPRLNNWRTPVLAFSWRTALKREYQTFYMIIVLFTASEIMGDFFMENRLVLDLFWCTLFIMASGFFFLTRLIHKKTKILHVRGR